MTTIAAAFLAFVSALAAVLLVVVARILPRRDALAVAVGLIFWLAYVGVLSALGVVGDPERRPPGIIYVVGPVVLFLLFGVVRSGAGARVAASVPLSLLIGLQTFRVGVELFLHRLWQDGLVPSTLTFEGANVDIWVGLSAPAIAWLATRGRGAPRLAVAWNVLGLLALANVVVRSALTAPGPLHLIDAEVANRAIGTFPYTFIAGFLAPLAVILHVLALRHVATRADRHPAGTGAPA